MTTLQQETFLEKVSSKINGIITIYAIEVYEKRMKLCDALEKMETDILRTVKEETKEWLQQKQQDEKRKDDLLALFYSSFDAEQKDFLKGYDQAIKDLLAELEEAQNHE